MRCFGDVVPQPYSNRIEELINNYEKVISIIKVYLSVSDEVSFDTYFTSRLADEEQELLKEVLGNEK